MFSFVFWRKSMTPKNHFKINWPLIAQNKLKMVLSENKLLLLCFYNLLLVQFGNTAKNSSPKPTFMTTVNIIKADENSDGEEITDSSSSESM